MKRVISVHIPKTAGESFYKTLSDFYGQTVTKDYKDYPINTPPTLRKKASLNDGLNNIDNTNRNECIHGHFLPLKYLPYLNTSSFITWLRAPVERAVSHYYYWIERSEVKAHAPLHKRVVEENWSLEEFCFSPELQNLYEQFLWGFPLRYFDFIGITEHYSTDLSYFSSKYLDGKSIAYQQNSRATVNTKYIISPSLRKEIELFHSKDMDLYQRAYDMRTLRIESS